MRNVRLLGLRHARRGPIKIQLRILFYVLVRETVLPRIIRVRRNVVLIPMDDRIKCILPVVGGRWRSLMQG